MKILLWNVSGVGSSANYPFRATTIHEYVSQGKFDLMALMEFGKGKSSELVSREFSQQGMNVAQTPNTLGARDNILLASRKPFEVVACKTRWLETYHAHIDMNVLTVHIPDKNNELKSKFWRRVLNYAEARRENRAMILGDLNSCAPEDSHTGTPYNPGELRRLREHGWIDCWDTYATERDGHNRYTWGKGLGNFRIDYAFISPATAAQVSIRHDHDVRKDQPAKEGYSDHSAVTLELR